MEALWTPDLLVAAAQAQLDGAITQTIAGFSIDTRSIKPGDVFVALKDARDGHEFVTNAFKAGAAAALVATSYIRRPGDGVLIRVDDPLRALERIGIAARARLSADARVIAVTGSVGKTSTKEMLRTALSGVGKTHAADKSFNNHWGVPLTLARMPADTRFGVFEIGMNHPGEIAPLARMVRPHVAIITTVEPVHLAAFASVEEIADAKAEIFDGFGQASDIECSSPPCAARDFDAPDGASGRSSVETVAILNRDNAFFGRIADRAMAADAQVLSFGEHPQAMVRLIGEPILGVDGCTALAQVDMGEVIQFSIGLKGRHQVGNALAVIAACHKVCAPHEFAGAMRGLGSSRAQAGRGEAKWIGWKDGTRICLIDDSYNANPASVRAALAAIGLAPELDHPAAGIPNDAYRLTRDALKERGREDGRRIAVLGDMLELGDTAPALHLGLKPAIAEAGVDKVFACGPHMKGLFDSLDADRQGGWAANSKELVTPLLAAVKPGDVIMVKGSLGSRMAVIVEALNSRFRGEV